MIRKQELYLSDIYIEDFSAKCAERLLKTFPKKQNVIQHIAAITVLAEGQFSLEEGNYPFFYMPATSDCCHKFERYQKLVRSKNDVYVHWTDRYSPYLGHEVEDLGAFPVSGRKKKFRSTYCTSYWKLRKLVKM